MQRFANVSSTVVVTDFHADYNQIEAIPVDLVANYNSYQVRICSTKRAIHHKCQIKSI